MNSTTDPKRDIKNFKLSKGGRAKPTVNHEAFYVPSSEAPMTLPDDIELREALMQLVVENQYIDGMTEYMPDTALDSTMELIATYRKKWEAEARLGMIGYYDQIPDNKAMDWKGLLADNRKAVECELSQLKEKTSD